LVGEEFGYKVETVMPDEVSLEEETEKGTPEPRPPVVTVMGHVDHGKTSLLDSIRKADVISGEAGGITQHIGAYTVKHNDKPITFIDTPGHQAFTAMRARGAKVTDIAILVVAADDGVKAQTVEAIDHARAAGVPIVVAINKIDKPEANPDKVKKELSNLGLAPEDWGGSTVFVEVSAKQNIHIDELLELIQLVAEMSELKSPKDVPAHGVAIEAKLDKGRGAVATVLVQKGVLKVGDIVVAGSTMGKVRALIDDKGRRIKEAGPSQPVEILGLASVPSAGDEVFVVEDEKRGKQIVEARKMRDEKIRRGISPTIEFAKQAMEETEFEELRLIVKADVNGSLGAIIDEIEKQNREDVKVNVIHKGVGAITETDVMLASASNGIIIGFNVRPDVKAKEMAEKEKVQIRLHRIIYQVVEDVRAASVGLLKPQIEEEDIGRVEVRTTFKVPKIGIIAGCFVTDGEVSRDSLVRLVRDGVIIYDGKIASLRRFKEDVQNVKAGFECGVSLENFKDIKEGDVFEIYKKVEKPRE
jgi:translation initiation factor IF-2